MDITYQTRLITSSEADRIALVTTLELQQQAVNFCCREQFGCKNKMLDLHKKVYYPLRTMFPQLPSQYIIKAYRECLAWHKASKTNDEHPKVPFCKKSLTSNLDTRICVKKHNGFAISTVAGRVLTQIELYPKLEFMLRTYKMNAPSIMCRNGELWMRLSFAIPEIHVEPTLACGVDLGIRRAAVTSEGMIFNDAAHNGRKRSLQHLKVSLRKKKTKSSRRHLKKLHGKQRRRTRNFCHHLSKKILVSTLADTIVLEDLIGMKRRIKAKSKCKKLSSRLYGTPFFKLYQYITYKAHLHNKQVITVCPTFTSQIDYLTGHRSKKARRGSRYYSRSGLVYDADVNAAINIAKRSKIPVSYARVLNGQAVVNRPIVGHSPASQAKHLLVSG